jgi:LysM repeat protein
VSEVDVPGVGGVNKKVLLAVGGGGAAYVLYRYYKARKDAAAAAAPADTPGYDQTSGDTLPVVPGAVAGVGTNGETTTDLTGSSPTTNAAWSQAAEQYLVGAGYDPTSVLKALGDYLANRALSADEQSIVQAAIAVAGYPPQGTFNILPAVSTGGSTASVGQVQGLHSTAVTSSGFQINWYATTGASGYHVYEGGNRVATDYGTYHPFNGRQPGTQYGPFTVAALNMDGTEGPASAPLMVTTSKAAATTTAPAPAAAPKPAAPKPASSPSTRTVIVKHGDTLSGIASANGITLARLKQLNPVYWTNPKYRDGSLIYAGDKVVV